MEERTYKSGIKDEGGMKLTEAELDEADRMADRMAEAAGTAKVGVLCAALLKMEMVLYAGVLEKHPEALADVFEKIDDDARLLKGLEAEVVRSRSGGGD